MHRVIGIAGLLTAALVLYLFIEVRAEPDIEVDPEKLAEARERTAVRQRPSSPPASSPVTWRAPEPKPQKEPASQSAAPQPLAAAGMSMKSISATPPELEGKPFVTKVKEARRLYGRRRYEQAYALAVELLEEEPRNRRVLRVVVASACIMAMPDEAAKYYERLSLPRDRRQMHRRCQAYGVELPEPEIQ